MKNTASTSIFPLSSVTTEVRQIPANINYVASKSVAPYRAEIGDSASDL